LQFLDQNCSQNKLIWLPWNEVFRNMTVSENYWTNETLENRFWRQFPAYYRQINVMRSKLIWTSWRPHLKIWAYGLNFLGVWLQPTRRIRDIKNCWCKTGWVQNASHKPSSLYINTVRSDHANHLSDRAEPIWHPCKTTKYSIIVYILYNNKCQCHLNCHQMRSHQVSMLTGSLAGLQAGLQLGAGARARISNLIWSYIHHIAIPLQFP